MGIVFGSVEAEQPSYLVENFYSNWQVRHYDSYIVAETSFKANKIDGKERSEAYKILAAYIGEFGGAAHNKGHGRNNHETIEMTAPVFVKQVSQKRDEISHKWLYKIYFVIPSKYKNISDVPLPEDPRVTVRQIPERFVAVTTFNGCCTTLVASEKAKWLLKSIQEDNTYTFIPPENENELYYYVAFYNPPFTIPLLRTNEIMIPVRLSGGINQPHQLPQHQHQQIPSSQHQQTLPYQQYTPSGPPSVISQPQQQSQQPIPSQIPSSQQQHQTLPSQQPKQSIPSQQPPQSISSQQSPQAQKPPLFIPPVVPSSQGGQTYPTNPPPQYK